MSLLASRRAEREQAEIDQLVARVHGAHTCHACGSRTGAETDRSTSGIDGRTLGWATCADCAEAEHRRALDREVTAMLLEIDEGAVPPGFRLPRFCDEPGSMPSRPNTTPWQHVDNRELARLLQIARDHLASVTDVACSSCGDTRRFVDRARTPTGQCDSCDWHLGPSRRFVHEDGRRDYAAAWLMGMGLEGGIPQVQCLGGRVGLRFFHELTPEEQDLARGARQPFSWHDTDELVEWRELLGLDRTPPDPPPPRPPRRVARMNGVRARTKPPKRPPRSVDPAEVVEARRAQW